MINLFMLLLRGLVTLIDYAIYSLAAALYNTILLIADINIFSGNINGVNLVQKISGNIYAFLGIFMLFRLAVAFVQYIMEPEKLSDSKIGGQKLALRILVVIFLIIGTPLIFKEAINLQQVLLKEDFVGKIILGTGSTSDNSGDAIVYAIYKNGVAYVNPKFLTVDYESGKANYTFKNVNGTTRNAICSFLQLKDKVSGCTSDNFESVSDLLSGNVFNIKSGDDYVFEHRWLISLLVGGFLCYVLLLTCIDVGLRSVKLAFYQMIAPIPIVSYLVPGQDGMLKKWSGEAIKTYLSVFITLAAFQFGFLLISYIYGNIGYIYEISDNIFVFLFLVLGILMFIKQMPEILKGIGLDVNGGFGLSLGKRLSAAAPAIGLGAGGVAGAITSYKARREAGGGIGRSLLSGVGGGLAGSLTGLTSGINNKDGKGMLANAMKSTHARANNIKTGQGLVNRWVSKAKENLGFDSENDAKKRAEANQKIRERKNLYDRGKQITMEAEKTGKVPKKFVMDNIKTKSETDDDLKKYYDSINAFEDAKDKQQIAKNALAEAERDFKNGIITAEEKANYEDAYEKAEKNTKDKEERKTLFEQSGKFDDYVKDFSAIKEYENNKQRQSYADDSQTRTGKDNGNYADMDPTAQFYNNQNKQ